MLWMDIHTSYNSVGPHPVSSLHKYTFGVSRAFMAGAASQAGDADSSRAPRLTSGLQGSVNVHRRALLLVQQWQCIRSFVFYTCMINRIWGLKQQTFRKNGHAWFLLHGLHRAVMNGWFKSLLVFPPLFASDHLFMTLLSNTFVKWPKPSRLAITQKITPQRKKRERKKVKKKNWILICSRPALLF